MRIKNPNILKVKPMPKTLLLPFGVIAITKIPNPIKIILMEIIAICLTISFVLVFNLLSYLPVINLSKEFNPLQIVPMCHKIHKATMLPSTIPTMLTPHPLNIVTPI